MTNVLLFLAFLALALIVGVRIGFRWARAGHALDSVLAAQRRDWDVCDEADCAITGEPREVAL